MARRRKSRMTESGENLDRWLLTYADLITLLLAFFVVMYAMSQIDAKRFGRIADALNGVLKGGDNVLTLPGEKTADDEVGHGILKFGNLKSIQAQIREKFEKVNQSQAIQTEITERGLVIHIMESALFREGSADLEGRARELLGQVADVIRPLPNHVRVEGHTDDRQISTPVYPSNWELSSARATEVVRYLSSEQAILPSRISALGYGEFRPRKPNSSIENRSQNRRVDIVVLTMELTLKEPSSQLYGVTEE